MSFMGGASELLQVADVNGDGRPDGLTASIEGTTVNVLPDVCLSP